MVSCVYKVIFVFMALYTIYIILNEGNQEKKHGPQQLNKENSCLGTVKQMIWLIPGQAQVGASLSSLARSKKINMNEEFSQKETLIWLKMTYFYSNWKLQPQQASSRACENTRLNYLN